MVSPKKERKRKDISAASADKPAKKQKRKSAELPPPKTVLLKIIAAIRALQSTNGSSSQAIKKYLESHWGYVNDTSIKSNLKSGVNKGVLEKNKASFRVAGDPIPEDNSPKVKINVTREGKGEEVVCMGDSVTISYIGTLEKDGSVFDKASKFSFVVEAGEVVKGMDKGVMGMKLGEKRQVVIPPELGYGKRGSGPEIPGGAILVFDILLKSIDSNSH